MKRVVGVKASISDEADLGVSDDVSKVGIESTKVDGVSEGGMSDPTRLDKLDLAEIV